jgi:hypothetical protein
MTQITHTNHIMQLLIFERYMLFSFTWIYRHLLPLNLDFIIIRGCVEYLQINIIIQL